MKQGFTLLELVVVIAITATLTTVGLASYNTLSKQQKIVNETKRLEDTLQTAKQKAIASENTSLCNNGFDLKGYTVTLKLDPVTQLPQILLNAVCKDKNDLDQSPQPQILSYPVDQAVIVVNSLPVTVTFDVLTGNATIVGTPPITLKVSTTRKRCISVSSLGTIDEDRDGKCLMN